MYVETKCCGIIYSTAINDDVTAKYCQRNHAVTKSLKSTFLVKYVGKTSIHVEGLIFILNLKKSICTVTNLLLKNLNLFKNATRYKGLMKIFNDISHKICYI